LLVLFSDVHNVVLRLLKVYGLQADNQKRKYLLHTHQNN
jgi:hypothetical protein